MKNFILKENVLTDDILYLAEDGKIFKGGFIAIIKYYTFLNSWSDKENVIRFKSENQLNKYLTKNYPDFEMY